MSDVDTRVKCAICERKSQPELMKTFTGGFVHYLCERIAWRISPREEQEDLTRDCNARLF